VAERRLLWEQVGVACDALSTTVLTAGLRPLGSGPLATTLRLWSGVGQAAQVLLAQLGAYPVEAVGQTTIWTVENPAVVAAALRRFGRHCPPIGCAAGWPNSAVVELLRQLRRAGARLRYHGDLDGDGLRIASYVIARTGAEPWRLTAGDYVSAVNGPAHRQDGSRTSRGIPSSEERCVDEVVPSPRSGSSRCCSTTWPHSLVLLDAILRDRSVGSPGNAPGRSVSPSSP
jgi:uncharacterized protein (TIGR02679 family)